MNSSPNNLPRPRYGSARRRGAPSQDSSSFGPPIRAIRVIRGFSLLSLLLAGCATQDPPAASDDPPPEVPTVHIAGDEETDHLIGKALADKVDTTNPTLRPGYVLDITVLAKGTPEFEEKGKRVSMEGTILLPLLGNVQVAGLTLPALTEQLTRQYGEYLRDSHIILKFTEGPDTISPWGYVTVLGRVARPGRVNMPVGGDMSVSMAVQAAGGFGKSARDTGIIVVRKNGNDQVLRYEVNLRDVVSRGEDADMRLTTGDVIYVPVRVF